MSTSKKRMMQRAISKIVEILEKRLMMSTGALTGAPGNNTFTIAENFATQQYIVTGGLNTPAPFAAAGLTGFTLTGGGSAASLTIVSGRPTLLNDAGADGTGLSVTIDSGASLSFASTEHLTSLTVNSGATAHMLGTDQVLVTGTLSLSGTAGAWTGTLDMGDSDMIVHNGSIGTITSQIASGYTTGYWNGSGIQSTAARTDTTHLSALGILVNDAGGGTPFYSTFDGQTTVSTDVLVTTTLYGDATLDRQVDGSDYTRIDNGYLTHLTGWNNGDFNYDGVINGSDYTLIDNAFNTQSGLPTPSIRLSGESTVVPGTLYTLNFNVVGSNDASAIGINWGDGNTSTAAPDATSATHIYSLSGNYRVTVTATINGVAYNSSSFGLDASFGQDGIVTSSSLSHADALAGQPADGDILVLDAVNHQVEAFTSDGSVDNAFGNEGVAQLDLQTVAKAIAVDPSGNVLVAGLDASGNLVVERLTSTGSLDNGYGPGGNALVQSSAPASLLDGGAALLIDPTNGEAILGLASSGAFEVARILGNGAPDPNAGTGGIFTGPNVALASAADLKMAFAPDGSVILSGLTSTGSVLEQFNKSGGQDTAFNSGAPLTLSNSVTALAASGLGNIFVATFTSGNRAYIESLNASGTANAAFGASGFVQLPVGTVTSGLSSLTVEGNNDLLAVCGNGPAIEAAQYQEDGSLDTTFGNNGLFTISLAGAGSVGGASAFVQADGQIVAAATLAAGSTSQGEVVRVNQTNQIAVQQSLSITPYQLQTPILAGRWVVLDAQGSALSQSNGTLNWTEYRNGLLVESLGAQVADFGYSYTFTTLNPGQYTVTLATGDATADYSFTVLANPPTVTLSGPLSTTPGSVIVVIANAVHNPSPPSADSFDPTIQTGPGATMNATFTYSWSVSFSGTGSFTLPSGTVTNLSSLYFPTDPSAVAQYVVAVTVQSSDGGGPVTVSRTINVGGVPAVNLSHGTTALVNSLSEAHSVVIQPDGKIVVAGLSTGSDGSKDLVVVRYNQDLSLDTIFGSSGIDTIALNTRTWGDFGDGYDQTPILLQPDGKIDVGAFEDPQTSDNNGQNSGYSELFRINANGTPDDSFGAGLSGVASIQFTTADLDQINRSSGSQVPTSGTLGMVLLDNGDVVTSQELSGPNSFYYALTEWDSGGNLNQSFGVQGVASIAVPGTAGAAEDGKRTLSLAVEPNGMFVVGGASGYPIQQGFNVVTSWFTLAAFNSDGSIDTAFGNMTPAVPGISETQFGVNNNFDIGAIDKLLTTVVDGVPYIVAAGTDNNYGSFGWRFAFVEYSLTGQANDSFGPNGNGTMEVAPYSTTNELADASILPDGSIAAVGDNNLRQFSDLLFGPSNTSTNLDIVKLTPGGLLDTTFNGSGEEVLAVPYSGTETANTTLTYGMALDGNDWVIVGGAYTSSSSPTSDYLVLRYHPDIHSAAELTATATPQGTINLNWTTAGNLSDSYGVERSDSEAGTYTYIGATDSGVTTYEDASVLPGTTYWYKVYPLTPTSSTTPQESNPATATTAPADEGYAYVGTLEIPVDGTAVSTDFNLSSGVPYLLVATGNISQTADGTHRGDSEYAYYTVSGVTNWWLDNPFLGGAFNYQYGFTIGPNTSSLDTFYTKSPYWGPLATDTNHTYSVLYAPAANGALYANYHDIYYPDNSQTNPGDIPLQIAIYRPLPPTPANVVAKGNTATRSIDLAWNLPAASWINSSTQSIVVQRSNDGGVSFATVATVPANQQNWSDQNVLANTSYIYRLLSQSGADQSRPSNETAGTLIVNPPQIQPVVRQVAVRNKPFTMQINATDPQYELDGLSFAITSSIPGLAIDSHGVISGWVPSDAEAGNSYPITVTVTDSANVSSSMSFVAVVPSGTSPIQITPGTPTIASPVGNRYALSVTATEPGVDPSDLFYSWSAQWIDPTSQPPPMPTFSLENTPEANNTVATVYAPGGYTFTVMVTDSLGNAESASVNSPFIAATLNTLTITVPSPSILTSTGSETLSAQGIDQFGNSIAVSSVTWNVINGIAGSFVPGTSQFNADSSPGVVTVLATVPVGGSSVSAMANIEVSGLTAPTGLQTTDVQPNGVALSWNASTGSNLAGYDVRESLSPDGPFVSALNGTLLTTTSTPTPIGTLPGATYYFEVVAEDTSGIESPPSDPLMVVVPPEDKSQPPAPSGLTANAAAVNYGGQTRVVLNWNAITGLHILGYDVYRSTIPNFVPGASNLLGSSIDNEYIDNSNLTFGVYYYVVETANDVGDSGPSNEASVNLSAPVLPPSAPTNVAATAQSGTSVLVTWTDVSQNETEFLIARSNSTSGPWTQVGVVPTNVTSFSDTVASLGAATFYEITAVNTAGRATSNPTSGITGSTPTASGIVLVPNSGTALTGGTDQITAEVVDQYGNPLATQPSFSWTVLSNGAGGTINSTSGLYSAPATLNSSGGVLLDQDIVQATANGFTGQVTIQVVAPQAPGAHITSLSKSAPTLLQQDTEIDGIVTNPAHGTLTYTLTVTPVSGGGGAITISSGTSTVGSDPNVSAALGTLQVASLPDGTYTLTLTASDYFASISQTLTNSDSVLIQVQSTLKLGNLSIPFTDLTISPSGSNPIPITRTYDSSTAGNDTGMGYGWTLNVTGTDLRSTVQPQNGITQAPGYQDGNLVYITTPDGVQHTFEFLAKPSGDFEDSPLAGIFGQIEQYTPQFLCVDGSGAKLILADEAGEDVSGNFTLNQDGGRYIDESGTGQNWFNPTNFPSLHLQYILKTVDGTQYSVDPTSGQLMSSTDANNNTTTYSSGSLYNTSTGSNGDISAIADSISGQTIHYFYGTDSGNLHDLIGSTEPTNAKTTYIYGDQLVLPSGPAYSAYAIITRTSDNFVWDTSLGWVASSSDDHLSMTAIADSTGTTAWFAQTGPGIIPGTDVSIAYYKVATSGGAAALADTESRTWSAPHLLTGVIDSNGVSVLTAAYDPSTSQLVSLVNATKQSSSVNTGGFDGTTGDQTVTDAAGNTTENIYDQYGNVIRKIQTLKNGSTITGYLVTVSTYGYFNSTQAQASFDQDFAETGVDLLNDPAGQVTYAPFEVTGADPGGLRYSEQPPAPPQQIISYYQWNGDPNSLTSHPEYGKVESVMTLIGPGTTARDWDYDVTNYNYSSSSAVFGKPTASTQQLGEYSVSSAGATTLVQPIGPSTVNNNTYDSNGNLQTSQDSTGITTMYTYSNSSSGIPAGLLMDTYRSSSFNSSGWVLASSNAYYGSTNASIGAVAGLLQSTTTYNYEYRGTTLTTLSQTTYDVYDAQGNVLLTYTPKNIGTSTAPNWVWSADFTTYNMNGQTLFTSQATYADPASTGSSTDQMNIAITWNTAANSNTTGGVTVSETLYTPVAPLPSSQTRYTGDGQPLTTTDKYGGITTNTYDSAGNLVRTLYPDGTELRSIYNAMGQVVWRTDRYATITLSSGTDDNITTANATETMYNSAGEVAGTERFSGVLITVGADPNAGTSSGLEETTVVSPTNPGTPLSTTATIYNAAGETVETDSASGLRTGTIYYPDGSVEYTGTLNPLASTTWYLSANPTGSFLVNSSTGRGEYTTYLYNLTAPISADPWSGLTYDQTIDANGHSTETFNDTSGRTIFTVYADNSFTESLYSNGDQAITSLPSTLIGSYSLPSISIPQGGSETINIAQRKNIAGDLIYLTVDVYDPTGNLVDVFQPAVADALNGNAMTAPHTHYDYDASGNELDQIDAKGEATTAAGNTTSWTYDARGNELSRTLPDGEQESFTYNVYGQVATHTDFDGNKATYTYYSNYSSGAYAGSLKQVEYVDTSGSGKAPETVGYTYDSLGRLLAVSDTAEETSADPMGTTTNTYDSQGNLWEQQTPEGTIWYVFDPTTGEQTETYTNFTETDYGYNTQGQLISTTVSKLNGTTLATPLVTSDTYDGAGNKVSETLPDGEVTRYAYDSLNRLTSMNESQSTTTLFSENFVLNDDGTRQSASESQLQSDNSTTTTLNYGWGYDADGRLLSESLSSSNTSLNYSDNYGFDLDSNIITDTHTGAGGTAGTTTNHYNGDNQLMNSSIGSVFTQYHYDLNGSQISVTVNGSITTTYGYDVRNRMIAYNGSGSASYVYNDASERVAETSDSTTTYYVTAVQNPTGYAQPLEEHQNSTTVNPSRTYFVGDHVFGQYNTSSSTFNGSAVGYLLIDGHGSTQQITSSSGTVSAALAYTAYGTALNFDPAAMGGAYFFGGDAVYDRISGLYMHGDGERDRLGIQFIQADGPGNGDNADPLSLPLYLYGGANPVSNVDPTGHEFLLELEEVAAEGGQEEAGDEEAGIAVESEAESVVDLAGLYSRLAAYLGLAVTAGGTGVGLSYYWLKTLQQIQLQQQAVAKAYQQALQKVVSTGKYTQRQANNLPVFYVFLKGAGSTPQIWANDAAAMAGLGTKGGLPAPDVLNYLLGINKINRPQSLAWAKSVGIVAPSLDEYPFASTVEGGPKPWLRVATVPASEQTQQGTDLGQFYGTQRYRPFTFLVVLVP